MRFWQPLWISSRSASCARRHRIGGIAHGDVDVAAPGLDHQVVQRQPVAESDGVSPPVVDHTTPSPWPKL